jgi:hypothetical protein
MQGALVNPVLKQALNEAVVAGSRLRPIVAVIEPEPFQPVALLWSERYRFDLPSFCHLALLLITLLLLNETAKSVSWRLKLLLIINRHRSKKKRLAFPVPTRPWPQKRRCAVWGERQTLGCTKLLLAASQASQRCERIGNAQPIPLKRLSVIGVVGEHQLNASSNNRCGSVAGIVYAPCP